MKMKLRLLILSLFISFIASAQPTSGYTTINSGYNWLRGYFRALNLPVGCGGPALSSGQWNGSGGVYLDSCNRRLYYYNQGTFYGLVDSVNLSDSTAVLRTLIASGAIASDSLYRIYNDSLPQFRTDIALKVNAADSSTNGGYYPYATNPKSYLTSAVTSVSTNTSTGITGGTITGTGTIAADTLLLSTRAWRQKGIDSVVNMIPHLEITADKPYRFWQGVVVNNLGIFTFSDRDSIFGLSNTIEQYDFNGKLLQTKRDAYTGTDSSGRFMSFGSGNFDSDTTFLVTAYNYNSGGSSPWQSKIVRISANTLQVKDEYPIGNDVAEGVFLYSGDYYVCYHNTMVVRKFNSSFVLQAEYSLSRPIGTYGGYQSITFIGSDVYMNYHGPNNFDGTFTQGLDHYTFDGSSFTFVDNIEAPTYGSGQSMCYYDGHYYWNDRPSNKIIRTSSLGEGAYDNINPFYNYIITNNIGSNIYQNKPLLIRGTDYIGLGIDSAYSEIGRIDNEGLKIGSPESSSTALEQIYKSGQTPYLALGKYLTNNVYVTLHTRDTVTAANASLSPSRAWQTNRYINVSESGVSISDKIGEFHSSILQGYDSTYLATNISSGFGNHRSVLYFQVNGSYSARKKIQTYNSPSYPAYSSFNSIDLNGTTGSNNYNLAGWYAGTVSRLALNSVDSVENFSAYSVIPSTSGHINTFYGLFEPGTMSGVDSFRFIYNNSPSINYLNGSLMLGDNGIAGQTYSKTANASAILELNSTSKGFIPSRMTASQRTSIGSPSTGLFIWDSDSSRYFGYNGSGWKGISWTSDVGGGGSGDMLASTYDPASISEQLVGLTATQSLTNKSVNGVTLITGGSSTSYLSADGTYSTPAGSIGGSTGSTDNRILRADGTGGSTVQASSVTIDDSGNFTGVGTMATGAITIGSLTSGSALITPLITIRKNGGTGTSTEFYNNTSVTGQTSGLSFKTDNGSGSSGGTITFYTASKGFEVSDQTSYTRIREVYGGNSSYWEMGSNTDIYPSTGELRLGAGGTKNYFTIGSTGALTAANVSSIGVDTSYKVMVIDGSGNIRKSYWAYSGGSSGETNTASNVAATVNPNYAGFYKTKSGVDLQFKSISTPDYSGITISNNTNEIEVKNSGYDFYDRNQILTTSTSVANAELFDMIQNNTAGIITVEITGLTTNGSFTTTRSIAYNKLSGTLTLGTGQVIKTNEELGTFSTPTIAWTTSSNYPLLTIQPGDTTTTSWNITFKVSTVTPLV